MPSFNYVQVMIVNINIFRQSKVCKSDLTFRPALQPHKMALGSLPFELKYRTSSNYLNVLKIIIHSTV